MLKIIIIITKNRKKTYTKFKDHRDKVKLSSIEINKLHEKIQKKEKE